MKNRIKEIESYIQKLPDDKKAIIEKTSKSHSKKICPLVLKKRLVMV